MAKNATHLPSGSNEKLLHRKNETRYAQTVIFSIPYFFLNKI